jgi:hypothetical protein
LLTPPGLFGTRTLIVKWFYSFPKTVILNFLPAGGSLAQRLRSIMLIVITLNQTNYSTNFLLHSAAGIFLYFGQEFLIMGEFPKSCT